MWYVNSGVWGGVTNLLQGFILTMWYVNHLEDFTTDAQVVVLY